MAQSAEHIAKVQRARLIHVEDRHLCSIILDPVTGYKASGKSTQAFADWISATKELRAKFRDTVTLNGKHIEDRIKQLGIPNNYPRLPKLRTVKTVAPLEELTPWQVRMESMLKQLHAVWIK